ncbi:MAG: hypothetical protein IKT47_04525 [Oscillospiraceae bacterium]|nr:hypothetical protein [Oscillospiraceae bacterium]
MSIQSELNSRTDKLAAILAGANARISAKDGTAASNLSGLPAAIDSIKGGGGEEVITWHEYEVMPKNYDFPITAPDGHGIRKVTVLGDADLIPENIKKGVNLFNVAGSYVGYITVASEDDLPTDADDGTIAVVEG